MDFLLFPVRCYSCGKVLGDKQTEFEELISPIKDDYGRIVEPGLSVSAALDELGVTRYCCRQNILSPAVLPKASKAFRKIEEGKETTLGLKEAVLPKDYFTRNDDDEYLIKRGYDVEAAKLVRVRANYTNLANTSKLKQKENEEEKEEQKETKKEKEQKEKKEQETHLVIERAKEQEEEEPKKLAPPTKKLAPPKRPSIQKSSLVSLSSMKSVKK